ncbi:MAG: hypothetical protein ACON35_04920 [Candidatus Marinamargulisbacteria bacterium]
MKFILFIAFSFSLFAEPLPLVVNQTFMTHDIYNDGVTYNISTFSYTQNTSSENVELLFEDGSDNGSIKLGVVSSANALVDLLWEYQSIHSTTPPNLIQSVELNDLNNDQALDIIINYSDPDSEFPDQTISSFLINNKNKFEEISETFIKSRYELLSNSHIKYESPLALFGRPYVDEDTPNESKYWIDYYEFQGLKLVNINQKYRTFYESLKSSASNELKSTLNKVSTYRMSDEITNNQLQLEEYFNQITELKTIIHRSNKVLY